MHNYVQNTHTHIYTNESHVSFKDSNAGSGYLRSKETDRRIGGQKQRERHGQQVKKTEHAHERERERDC